MHAASEYTGEVRIVLLHPRLNFQSHFEMQRQAKLWGKEVLQFLKVGQYLSPYEYVSFEYCIKWRMSDQSFFSRRKQGL